MTDAAWDPDLGAAREPRVPPQVLADIAARRWDLHAVIAANPGAYPELLRWIGEVNPGALPQQQASWQASSVPSAAAYPISSGSTPPVPARRSRVGCWLAGCGCLALVGVFAAIAALGGLGLALSPDAPDDAPPPLAGDGAEQSDLAEQRALFREERARIDHLAAQLDGNPAAPLVADFAWLHRQDERMADPDIGLYSAQTIVRFTTDFRTALEQSIATASTRSGNATGSITEGLVDSAGHGFIDIRWDAATACSASDREEWTTTGCIAKGDSLTVHLLPEGELGSEWLNRMTTVHELAHIYQRADKARSRDVNDGSYESLLSQGLFQGSEEVMADCFALTYYTEWTLTDADGTELGYGYVCDESERQAIRQWAVEVDAPLQ